MAITKYWTTKCSIYSYLQPKSITNLKHTTSGKTAECIIFKENSGRRTLVHNLRSPKLPSEQRCVAIKSFGRRADKNCRAEVVSLKLLIPKLLYFEAKTPVFMDLFYRSTWFSSRRRLLGCGRGVSIFWAVPGQAWA